MNELCADIGYKSINHAGEQLCGDHVEIAEKEGDPDSAVIVLADGLGSGVKASILSTLTARIISTMMAAGLSLEECVATIADTLPVDREKEVAYSTFTVMHLLHSRTMELIQYDNPHVILIRDGANCAYPKSEMRIGEKIIFKSVIRLQEDDIFIAMSDGCPHAGTGVGYNLGWKREDIISFMEVLAPVGYTAKTLSTILVDECFKLYGGEPGDDATACVVKIRRRTPVNVLFGPPSDPDDADRMMSLFFSKEGRHIVCGGTTASIAARWLHKPLRANTTFDSSGVPPISTIEGVDLVTEGVMTVSKVLEFAKDYLQDNSQYEVWSIKKDGASQICRMLFEEATDIGFYVGRAVNPAHQNPDLPIKFHIKMNLVKELTASLKEMGKRVTVNYY